MKSNVKGFTLIELLVVALIASGIISGLMFLVVELLTADQREASKTQTQQEMQQALDYISAELREAVYIYDQTCMNATGNGVVTDPNYCPGLYNHLPTNVTPANNNHPILAFWKQQILPSNIRNACDAGTAPSDTPCVSGHSYALVVYTLDTDATDPIWDGLARIRRYSLTQFSNSSTAPTVGYVDPGRFQQGFRSWPFYTIGGNPTPTNQQGTRPANQNIDVLVDFVDNRVRDGATSVVCPNDVNGNPYLLTSDSPIVSTIANSFYGCVSDRNQTGENRDVRLFLRGNAQGRPAIARNPTESTFLPTLETQVLSRPVLEKVP